MANVNFSLATAAALRAILAEVTPGNRPYSGDSYLPEHLVEFARTALEEHDDADTAAHQHAHNSLSMAQWHITHGQAPQALARLRRAQTHVMGAAA